MKALKRRAAAYEHLGREEEAIRDYTATTIIEEFKDDTLSVNIERLLRSLADKKAKKLLEVGFVTSSRSPNDVVQTREPKLPSPTFISSYLSAFRPREP